MFGQANMVFPIFMLSIKARNMKGVYMLLFFLTTASAILAQDEGKITKDPYTGEDILLGKITVDDLRTGPMAAWFNEEYNAYEPDATVLEVLDRDVLSTWFVTIVLGTWCSDSQREFPRFIKIWDELGLSQEQLTIIAVNSKKEAPLDMTADLDIQRVPTFIFFQCNMELGRVVESPAETLEKELFRVLYEY